MVKKGGLMFQSAAKYEGGVAATAAATFKLIDRMVTVIFS